jgi:TetR/AcrR family transcriptional regulator of autoinduction and epiphytic fitness
MPAAGGRGRTGPAVEALDGRTLRSIRTREAIVDATIALLEEGDLRPTAPRVAAAASVSVRSIFQHFDDLETLHAAVADRLLERVSRLVSTVPSDGPLAARLEHLAHQRALLLELVTPIRRAADVHGPFSAEITARLRDGQAYLRDELDRTFAPELHAAGVARREVLDALDVAFSWATWEALRAGAGRTQEEAEAVLVRLGRSVLDHVGP